MSEVKMSVKFSIVGFSTLAVLLFGIIISIISYIGGRNSVYSLVDNIMDKASEHTKDKTLNYLEAAVVSIQTNDEFINSGLLKTNKSKILEKYFEGIVKSNSEFVGMFFGDESGNFVMVKEMPDKTYSIQNVIRKGKLTQIIWEHENETYYKKPQFDDEILPAEKAYNPTDRPWYKEAIQNKKHVWTEVYVFFNDRKPGITCSKAVHDKDGKLIGVIGIDISIKELSEFLTKLKIGETGKAFILDAKSNVVAIPSNDPLLLEQMLKEEIDNSGKKTLKLMKADSIFDPEIASSYKYFEKNKDKLSQDNRNFFEYSSNGNSYLAKYLPFEKDDIKWTIGIVVPEKEFMSTVHRNNQIIFAITFILIIIAVLFEYRFSQKISQPLILLSEEMKKIQNFDLTSDKQVHSFLIEVNNMANSFNKMRTGLRSFKKYVPDELVRELIALNKEAILEGERRELTIYFSDIAGFTSISEELSAEELVELLSDYLGSVTSTIINNHGTLDKYIGDAVMAFWGAPSMLEDHAIHACKAALEHKKNLGIRNAELISRGKTPFYDRIGIHTGDAIVGNMGSENRLNYTIIGDSVNLASRLEGINKYYGTEIIISENTYEKVRDQFLVRKIDLVAVKGKSKAIEIFELIAEIEEASLEQQSFADKFNSAVDFYRSKSFMEALNIFRYCSKMNPEDLTSKVYIERCEFFISNPPPADSNGVYESKTK